MTNYNPLLCLDFYKTAHAEQYPQTLTKNGLLLHAPHDPPGRH